MDFQIWMFPFAYYSVTFLFCYFIYQSESRTNAAVYSLSLFIVFIEADLYKTNENKFKGLGFCLEELCQPPRILSV